MRALLSKLGSSMPGAMSTWAAVLSVVLLTASLPSDGIAQKKKDKLSDEEQAREDSLAKAKYQFELAKNWSFGWENYKNKQYKNVARYFWKVIELDTTGRFDRVYRYLGQTYFEMSMPDSAQYVYQEGIKAFPEDASLRRSLAYLYTAREEVDSAIEQYEKIRELGAATEDDLKRVANLYVRTDQQDEAIETYEAILEMNPDDQEARNTLSQLYRVGGNEDKMIESIEQTLVQNSNDTQTLFNLARVRFDRQEFDKAIELLERYQQQMPDDVQAIELKGTAQVNLEQHREAIETFQKVVELDAKNKRVLVDIANSYRELGEYVSARSFANKALQIDSKYGYALLTKGRIYESCADKCVSKKSKADFNDKLAYKLAYEQYQHALQDLEYRSQAKDRRDYVQSLIPTSEDYFMNKNQNKAEGACYSWIY